MSPASQPSGSLLRLRDTCIYNALLAGTCERKHCLPGPLDRALATFAEAYADQNERDYATVRAAADAGEIAVRVGV